MLIAFVRSPGRGPAVWVRYPRHEGQARPEPMQAPVPQAVWDEVVQRSDGFDRSFAPRADADSEGPLICGHAWTYTIEAASRPMGYEPARIRRKTEGACERGPGTRFARDVERLALPLFPHCAALDPDLFRNPASMLDACRLLHGDRLAAAEVLNLAHVFNRVSTREEAGLMRSRFDRRATIDWNGVRNSGDGSALAFWIERIWAARRPSFFVQSVDGETADRVRLVAMLSRTVEGSEADPRYERARVLQIWVRDATGEMKVGSATVGPWEPSESG